MADNDLLAFNLLGSSKSIGTRSVTQEYRSGEAIFAQGDKADAMFYIQDGNVKLTVTSRGGGETIEGCELVGQFGHVDGRPFWEQLAAMC